MHDFLWDSKCVGKLSVELEVSLVGPNCLQRIAGVVLTTAVLPSIYLYVLNSITLDAIPKHKVYV